MKTIDKFGLLKRLVVAVIMLAVFGMPMGPDEDGDDFVGPTVLQVSSTREQTAIIAVHQSTPAPAPVASLSVNAPLHIAVAFTASTFEHSLFDPVSLLAFPLRP